MCVCVLPWGTMNEFVLYKVIFFKFQWRCVCVCALSLRDYKNEFVLHYPFFFCTLFPDSPLLSCTLLSPPRLSSLLLQSPLSSFTHVSPPSLSTLLSPSGLSFLLLHSPISLSLGQEDNRKTFGTFWYSSTFLWCSLMDDVWRIMNVPWADFL